MSKPNIPEIGPNQALVLIDGGASIEKKIILHFK
jgi:hypothetical protein